MSVSRQDAPKAQHMAYRSLKEAHYAEWMEINKRLLAEEGWPRTRTVAQRYRKADQKLKVRYPDEYRSLYLSAREEIRPGWTDGRASGPGSRGPVTGERKRRALRGMAAKRQERAMEVLDKAEQRAMELWTEAAELERQAREMEGL